MSRLSCRKLSCCRALSEFTSPQKYAPEVSRTHAILVLRAQICLGGLAAINAFLDCKFDTASVNSDEIIPNDDYVDFLERHIIARKVILVVWSLVFALVSLKYPWFAEYFILIPLTSLKLSPCFSIPRSYSVESAIFTLSKFTAMFILWGFVCKKHILFCLLHLSVDFLPPSFSTTAAATL